MADETQTQETAATTEESATSGGEERIQTLLQKVKDLENLVNVQERLKNVEQTSQETLARVSQPQPQQTHDNLSPEDREKKENWRTFLRPFLDEGMSQRDQLIVAALDETDRLKAMLAHPEYKDDPEFAAAVDKARLQRYRETNGKTVQSRLDVITYLKGLPENREKEVNKRAEELIAKKNAPPPVETSINMGGPRAAQNQLSITKEQLNSMSYDEIMKKFPELANMPL